MIAYAEYMTFGIALPLVLWFICTHQREIKGLSLLGKKGSF
ncbi:MAG TPA: hypothetical protein VHA09_05075 [Nitrososphaera sp.]|nr:hypothetical protein [Nitrososphaera sp.]